MLIVGLRVAMLASFSSMLFALLATSADISPPGLNGGASLLNAYRYIVVMVGILPIGVMPSRPLAVGVRSI